jgi:magnesium-transporting ATPase (P-type)
VLGFAERPAGPAAASERREQAEAGLTFLGVVALEDALRPEIVDAVARCRGAGIRVVMVTGDHGLTAAAIAREAGIVGAHPTIVTGAEIEALPQRELDRLLHEAAELIVARSNPETKLHLVDALRAEGHTVAMTGDGVNDAPALRRADIGVAMGASGTEVAREAATVVLTDDNFASIVAAVEEGRVVYDNVRKFITYIFTHAPAESIPFAAFVLSGGGIPLPLLPLQILAIDLGTDTVPALALGREPGEPGIMERSPRPRKSGIIQRSMLVRAWLRMGLVEAALAMLGFFVVLLSAGWSWGAATGEGTALHHAYLQATSMVWAGIVAGQIGAGFACRTRTASLRAIGVFSNRHLLRGVLFEVCFAAAIVYLPPLQSLFHTAALDPGQVALLATFPFVVWGTDEAWRAWRRRHPRVRRSHTRPAPEYG